MKGPFPEDLHHGQSSPAAFDAQTLPSASPVAFRALSMLPGSAEAGTDLSLPVATTARPQGLRRAPVVPSAQRGSCRCRTGAAIPSYRSPRLSAAAGCCRRGRARPGCGSLPTWQELAGLPPPPGTP